MFWASILPTCGVQVGCRNPESIALTMLKILTHLQDRVYWAAQELELSYYDKDTTIFTTYACSCNLTEVP